MVIQRGEVWWADLGEPTGSEPGFRRPVVIVQANSFNRSRIATTIAVILTSSLRLLDAPGNILIQAAESNLRKDSVGNVSQMVTLDKDMLMEKVGRLGESTMRRLDHGIRLVLALSY